MANQPQFCENSVTSEFKFCLLQEGAQDSGYSKHKVQCSEDVADWHEVEQTVGWWGQEGLQ